VRVSFLLATFVAFVSGVAAVSMIPALAQGQATNQPPSNGGGAGERHGTSVAVIDIKFIFDNHQRFKASMDEIKKDYDAFEASVRDTETSLRKKLEELKGEQPGSEKFKRLEEDVAHTRSQVQLDIGRRQKQRVEAEAIVYHRAYKEVEEQIRKFADRYGIDLVLQFSTTEIDPAKPDTVIRGLNRQVVFQRNLNITQYVLEELNRVPPIATNPNPPRPVGPVNPVGPGGPNGGSGGLRPAPTGPRAFK
jgi:Skp family chaperone for outer membrane proteins